MGDLEIAVDILQGVLSFSLLCNSKRWESGDVVVVSLVETDTQFTVLQPKQIICIIVK